MVSSQAVGDLVSRCKVRLIPIEGEQIDKLLKQHPCYQRSHIAANLYPGQTTSINNIGISAELLALASLPDPIVRTVRDTLLARVKQFNRLHLALSKVTPEQLQAQTELPLHAEMSDQPPAPLPLTPEQLTPEQLSPEQLTPESSTSEAAQTAEQVSAADGPTTPLEGSSDATATSSAAVATEAVPLPEDALEVTPELTAPATDVKSDAPSTSSAASTAQRHRQPSRSSCRGAPLRQLRRKSRKNSPQPAAQLPANPHRRIKPTRPAHPSPA